jgi:hypothetical protein
MIITALVTSTPSGSPSGMYVLLDRQRLPEVFETL